MISSEIKRVRKLKGLTQEQLGALIGISGVAIMRYEKGQREPNSEIIQKIADVLDTTPSQLMGWDIHEKEINKYQIFINYLNSIGYQIDTKPISDNFADFFLLKDNVSTKFTDEQFKTFQSTIEKSVEFEVFKQIQYNEK